MQGIAICFSKRHHVQPHPRPPTCHFVFVVVVVVVVWRRIRVWNEVVLSRYCLRPSIFLSTLLFGLLTYPVEHNRCLSSNTKVDDTVRRPRRRRLRRRPFCVDAYKRHDTTHKRTHTYNTHTPPVCVCWLSVSVECVCESYRIVSYRVVSCLFCLWWWWLVDLSLINHWMMINYCFFNEFSTCTDDAARQALDWGLMELQEFLEDEELALGVKGEGPGKIWIGFFSLLEYFLSFLKRKVFS